MKFGVGQSVPRTEDPRFLKGSGRYVADIAPANLDPRLSCCARRTPTPRSSRSTSRAAKAAPGVLLVLTGKRRRRRQDRHSARAAPPIAFGGPPKAFMALHQMLARERVRHVGDPVAFVVAETLHQARDAAELIQVDYEMLPAVIVTDDAAKPGAPLVWDGAPNNIWFALERGDKAATDAAFKKAAHVVTLRIVNNRLSRQLDGGAAPRSANTTRRCGRTTLHTSHADAAQGARRARRRGVPRAAR